MFSVYFLLKIQVVTGLSFFWLFRRQRKRTGSGEEVTDVCGSYLQTDCESVMILKISLR